MYARKITSEETYTLAEAKRIIKAEHSRKRESFLHKAKQKLMGITLIIIAILMPIIFDGDATVSLFALPLGIYLLITRERVVE